MKLKRRIAAVGCTCGLALAIATSSSSQTVSKTTLRENPYRNVGGSCVYGAHGDVLFAPKGSNCPDRKTQAPEPSAKGSTSSAAESLPAGVRGEANAILNDHDHIAAEIVLLRQAIAGGEREAALGSVEHVIAELTHHLALEEQLLDAVARKCREGAP